MRKNKGILTSIVLVVVIALFSFSFGFADAQEQKGPKPVGPIEQIIKQLKPTPEQLTQMEKMKSDLEKQQVQTRAKMQTAGIELRDLLSAAEPNKEAVMKKLDEVAKYRVEMVKNRIEQWFAVNKILTPEQQKIWKEALKNPPREHMKPGMMHGMMRHKSPMEKED
jgi:Spy/CpxP family protein refolding chaperone